MYELLECRAMSEALVELARDIDRRLLNAIEGEPLDLLGSQEDIYNAIDIAMNILEAFVPENEVQGGG